MPPRRGFDAVIIGGGHNGLVCAAYLAARGLVGVRRSSAAACVGGAAVTEEFHPGLPQLDGELHGQPARSAGDPRPEARRSTGSSIVERPFANFLPLPGERLPQGRRRARGDAGRGRASSRARDARALPAYYAMLDRVADVLRELLRADAAEHRRRRGATGAMLDAWKRRAALSRARRCRSGATCSTSSPRAPATCSTAGSSPTPIKAAFGFDAVVGNFASPYAPGSAYVLLHHVFGEVNGKRGQWGHAIGGMGAITQAMATRVRGARRRRSAPARRSRA